MCRYGDDCEWYVDAESVITLDVDQACEDCNRLVAAGDEIVQFTASVDEWERDNSPYVYVAQLPEPGQLYVREREPLTRLGEDPPEAIIDTFVALGFIVDEVCEYDLVDRDPVYHYSCRHCRVGNYWLQQVCDQHVVLVTREDLIEHRDEYTDEQLGRAFCTLETLARQGWRSKLTGELIPVHVIDRLTRDAVQHANATGLAA